MDCQPREIIAQDNLSRHRHDSIACRIEQVFADHAENLNLVIDLSNQIQRQIEALDPFIQKSTSAVCSECKDCCCVTRYSYYSCDDLIYIMALGLKPQGLQSDDDSGPCFFLNNNGCCLERTVRPSGCNWYICDSLYGHMTIKQAESYESFSNDMEKLFNLWIELICEFRTRFKELKGYDLEAVDLASDSQRKASRQTAAAWHL